MSNFSFIPIQGRLFDEMPSSEFGDTLLLGIQTIRQSEALAEMIVNDQDMMALEKKKLRSLDEEWLKGHGGQPLFDDREHTEASNVLRTKQRMSPEAVFVFFLVRSYLGDIKSAASRHFIEDSMTLSCITRSLGYDRVPGASTILDNLNCLSVETHDALLAESLAMAKKKISMN